MTISRGVLAGRPAACSGSLLSHAGLTYAAAARREPRRWSRHLAHERPHGQFDASIVTPASATLGHDFGALPADVRWVGQADLLALTGLLPAVGRYAGMFGSKLLDTCGFVARRRPR